MDDDDPEELADYQPHDEQSYGARRRKVLRVIVIVGLIALVLPGILVTALTADRTAQFSCAAYTAYAAPDAIGSEARFDLFGPSVGWNCYARFFGGSETLIAGLGIIPGGRPIPATPAENA